MSSSPDPKRNDSVLEGGSGCCGAGTFPAHVQYMDNPSDTSPISSKSANSMKRVEEKCGSGCCGSSEQEIVESAEVVALNEAEGCASGCCSGGFIIQAPTTRDDNDNNTLARAQCGSAEGNDSSSVVAAGPAKEELAEDGCAGDCCSSKPIAVAIEESKTDNCNDGGCVSGKLEAFQNPKGEMEQRVHGARNIWAQRVDLIFRR